MRANRSQDTRPEVALRSALHRRAHRFRKNAVIQTDAGRVRADIVFPSRRVAVFMDGCFWHACPEHGQLPTRNREYWEAKFRRNVARDTRQTAMLVGAGWTVVRVWEHTPIDEAVHEVESALRS